jgi:hypothetical protein
MEFLDNLDEELGRLTDPLAEEWHRLMAEATKKRRTKRKTPKGPKKRKSRKREGLDIEGITKGKGSRNFQKSLRVPEEEEELAVPDDWDAESEEEQELAVPDDWDAEETEPEAAAPAPEEASEEPWAGQEPEGSFMDDPEGAPGESFMDEPAEGQSFMDEPAEAPAAPAPTPAPQAAPTGPEAVAAGMEPDFSDVDEQIAQQGGGQYARPAPAPRAAPQTAPQPAPQAAPAPAPAPQAASQPLELAPQAPAAAPQAPPADDPRFASAEPVPEPQAAQPAPAAAAQAPPAQAPAPAKNKNVEIIRQIGDKSLVRVRGKNKLGQAVYKYATVDPKTIGGEVTPDSVWQHFLKGFQSGDPSFQQQFSADVGQATRQAEQASGQDVGWGDQQSKKPWTFNSYLKQIVGSTQREMLANAMRRVKVPQNIMSVASALSDEQVSDLMDLYRVRQRAKVDGNAINAWLDKYSKYYNPQESKEGDYDPYAHLLAEGPFLTSLGRRMRGMGKRIKSALTGKDVKLAQNALMYGALAQLIKQDPATFSKHLQRMGVDAGQLAQQGQEQGQQELQGTSEQEAVPGQEGQEEQAPESAEAESPEAETAVDPEAAPAAPAAPDKGPQRRAAGMVARTQRKAAGKNPSHVPAGQMKAAADAARTPEWGAAVKGDPSAPKAPKRKPLAQRQPAKSWTSRAMDWAGKKLVPGAKKWAKLCSRYY